MADPHSGVDPHALPGSDLVIDGVRLYVVRHGTPGEYVPWLLVHGVPTSGYLWHGVARDLGRKRQVVVPDLVGFGQSERPAGASSYRLDRQARLLLDLLDHLHLDRVAVAGHDLGGAIAVLLAAYAPERIAALAVIDAPVHPDVWPTPAALPWLLPGIGPAALALLRRRPALAHRVLARAVAPGADERELERYLGPLLQRRGGEGVRAFLAAVDLAPVQAALGLIGAAPPPTLVLWGEQDHRLSLAYARRICAAVPGATLVPVRGAGHLLPQHRPERVAEELAALI